MTMLYQVTIRWIKTEAKPETISPGFDQVGNWARLNVYSWFVWSNLTAEQIHQILRRYLQTEDSVAVFSVNPGNKAGWAPAWFWEWINSQGQRGHPG
jgi:hypothetical protein